MRVARRDIIAKESRSTFLSVDKDLELIIKKLFIESGDYSKDLKRLLLINTPDCLYSTKNATYNTLIENTKVSDLIEKGYVRLSPKIKLGENEDVKTYITITFDNFVPCGDNDYYRDCDIMIDIMCHLDYWNLGDYRLRPVKIMGYIDGILNEAKLSGIGTTQFITAKEITSDSNLGGYCLIYHATHGVEDRLEDVNPYEEEEDEEQ